MYPEVYPVGMPYQSKTYSLSDEAIKRLEALKDGYGSVNKALLALLPGGDSVGAVRPVEPAVSYEAASDMKPCRHCGQADKLAKMAQATRPCSDCYRDRHVNSGDCRRCVELAHEMEMERKSTACDTSNIEYTENWGA